MVTDFAKTGAMTGAVIVLGAAARRTFSTATSGRFWMMLHTTPQLVKLGRRDRIESG
jgi:hypothetical protein